MFSSPAFKIFCLLTMLSISVIIIEILFSCRCYLDELLDDYYMVFVIILSILYFLFPSIFSNTLKPSLSTTTNADTISLLSVKQSVTCDKKAIITSQSSIKEEEISQNTARRILKLSKKKEKTWKRNRKAAVPLSKKIFVMNIGKQTQEILSR